MLVTTLEDISALIIQSHDLDETLSNIVSLVAKRTESDVCSIYLFDEDRITLRLKATKGLSKKSVGRVTLQIGEGLTGLAVEERRTVAIQEPQTHPRYRYFKETKEERFHSFLGVPMYDRGEPIGVLVVQSKTPRLFSQEEISAFTTIAFQISSIVVNASLLDSIRRQERSTQPGPSPAPTSDRPQQEIHEEAGTPLIFRGRSAYPGVATGPVAILEELVSFDPIEEQSGIQIDQEIQRLESALEKTCIQTLYLEKRVAEQLSEKDAAVFHTHLMILEDRGFLDKIVHQIREGHTAEFSLKKVVSDYIKAFEQMDDQYLSERAADMKDIGRRILANLIGRGEVAPQIKEPGILVARELLPSEMARLDHQMIRGIVTEAAGANSHAVIMAKSLGIPAVVGTPKLLDKLRPGDLIILDANTGSVYINPPENIADEYRRLERDRLRQDAELVYFRDKACVTIDTQPIVLKANIGLYSDVEVALTNGAEGVGLYRTEFLFMTRPTFPDRNEQYQLYRRVIEAFEGRPVTIRTLDIGGDKRLPYLNSPHEENPFLGWRSIRFSLDNRDIFRTQIEGILMAAVHGPAKILFPMISGPAELQQCKEVIREAMTALDEEGIPYCHEIPIGIMIEVPSAVQLAPLLAKEVSFFAMGTNDLIQYLLATDRNNELVRKHYDPLHPAVLHAIQQLTRIAEQQRIELCICGEMANDPLHLTALIGLGVREFSVASPFIPRIKAFLSHLNSVEAERAMEDVMNMTDPERIRSRLRTTLDRTGAAHWLALM